MTTSCKRGSSPISRLRAPHCGAVLLMALLAMPLLVRPAAAQEFSAALGGDAVTRYNWRGLDFGDAVSVQPYLRAEFHGLKGGFWGSYSADFEEIDTWVSYSANLPGALGISLIATDYYFSGAGIRLFNFHGADHEEGAGAHLLEVGATVTGGPRFPLSVSAYVNVHNDPGDCVYLQLDYPASVGDIDLGFSVGATPGSNENPAYYGSDEFAVINLGVKGVRKLKWSDTEVAVSTAAIVNPRAEIAYLILGLGI